MVLEIEAVIGILALVWIFSRFAGGDTAWLSRVHLFDRDR